MMRPSYGLAEATVFVTAGTWNESEPVAHFDVGKLGIGRVERCAPAAGSALVSYEIPRSPMLRIVDSETRRECPPDQIGEMSIRQMPTLSPRGGLPVTVRARSAAAGD